MDGDIDADIDADVDVDAISPSSWSGGGPLTLQLSLQ